MLLYRVKLKYKLSLLDLNNIKWQKMAERQCPNCGFLLEEDESTCLECGYNIDEEFDIEDDLEDYE